MLRSVKYGLYGAVLAGVVGGSVAWSGVDKTVTLIVDGQPTKVHTTAGQVAGVLRTAGYRVGEHDIVAPSLSAEVHDGSTVVFRRGKLLHLEVNGVSKDVWTTAATVAEALGQLGYSTADFSSVSRAERLPLTPTDITVRTPKLVTIVHDGKKQQVTTTDATVGTLLADLGVVLGPHDAVSAGPDSVLRANEQIVIQRRTQRIVTQLGPVPFPTKRTNDPKLAKGTTEIVSPGKPGQARITYALIYVDGNLIGKTAIRTVVLQPPVAQVEMVGTGPTTLPVTPAQAQQIARAMLKQRGWGDDQFSCLATLWGHESGWRVTASNPSGAYGIPQALPGSKMGPGWQNDAAVQITWGLNYIHDRYSTPCQAWATWQANGGWY